MSLDKINMGDTVKHRNNDFEMIAIGKNKHWITCEYADAEGERVEKVYDQEFLVVVKKKPKMNINPDALKISFP